MAQRKRRMKNGFKEGDPVCYTVEGNLVWESKSCCESCEFCESENRGQWTIDGMFYLDGSEGPETPDSYGRLTLRKK